MNWSDERYVRVYTRDTPDWVALGWEAQALFLLILRKVDRAGVLDLGKSGEPGMADLLRMPIEIFDQALAKLLKDGCVTRSHTLSQLVVPNFLSAQEARQSDRQRQHETRARRRDAAKHPEQQNTGHTESHAVTSGHSVPSRTVPSFSKDPERPHAQAPAREVQEPGHSGPLASGSSCPAEPAKPPQDDPPPWSDADAPPPPPDRSRRPPAQPYQQRPANGGLILGSVAAVPRVCSKCRRAASPLVEHHGSLFCRPCSEPPAPTVEESAAALAELKRRAGWRE